MGILLPGRVSRLAITPQTSNADFEIIIQSDSAAVELQLSLTPWNDGSSSSSNTWCHFKISSWTYERGWLDHCRGLIAALRETLSNPVQQSPVSGGSRAGLEHQMGDLTELRERCKDPKDANDLYRICEEAGFHFGPTFRRVQDVQLGQTYEATYTVTIPDTLSCMPYSRQSDYVIHPINLDAVFQGATLFLADDANLTNGPYMPTSIEEVTVAVGMVQDPGSIFRVHATSSPPDAFSRKRLFNYVIRDTQRVSHPISIVAKGVVESPVQGVEIAQARSESRCLRIRWEPSMSYLTQDDSEAMLSLPPPKPYDPQTSRYLEKIGLGYIQRALRQTNFDKLPATYVQKLYAWMESKLYEANGYNANNEAHEADGVVFDSEMPVESFDCTPHGIKEDLNGACANSEAVVKANSDITKSKADNSNGDSTNGQVTIDRIDDAPEGILRNGHLLNENGPDEIVPIGKVHHKLNGDLTNDPVLERKMSNVKNRKRLVGNHDNTSISHAESTQLAISLIRRVGDQLPAILQGQTDPAVLMSEDDLLSRFKSEYQGMSRLYSATATYIQKLAFQSPVLRM